MKRKKKRLSTLVRVLLCSWCVLGLVLAFFVIDWAMNLQGPEELAGSGSVDTLAKVTGEADPTRPVTPTEVPEATAPAATTVPMPKAEFVTEYAHMGEAVERYGYMDKVTYGLRYPHREDAAEESEADRIVQELLSEKLAEFSKDAGELGILLIDYEDGETTGLYSVLFYVEWEIDGVKETETRLWLYNKKKGETVDGTELFADRAYTYVAQQVNRLLAEEATSGTSEEGIDNKTLVQKSEGPFSGTREEFAEYVLTADGAKFYYETDGKRQSIVIPYIALHTYMAVTENGTVVADSIRELDPDKPMIALTFDDGPNDKQTPRLLEILEKNNARATFFVLGDRVLWGPANKNTLKMVYESGNEVASHTYSHKKLKELSVEGITEEIVKARDAVYSVIGEYPTLIRPPYGGYNDLVKEYSYAPLITWNLDSEDWKSRDAQKVVDQVLKEARDGNIVLMHDIHWFTVDAAEVLIPALMERGYQIVTVQELFHYKNVELENGRVYHSSYN